ncbi:DUF4870 family protein [Altererythrobacter sp. MF3-039]|uniref:DUF4870 family protein n=1 Tax=Altererythrobacter sp. MF3-039 TaxID=3252901 RepID=UPI00390C71AC
MDDQQQRSQPTRLDSRPPANSGGFDANRPTVVSLLYLASLLTGITGLVGIVLAHVWRGDGNEAWMESHFTYLIRTFWIGFAASIVAALLSIVLIGFLLFPLIAIWFAVRSVMSFMKAQRREPMPDPQTLLF